MSSITKILVSFKGKIRRLPLDIVVAILISLITFTAFLLGWKARAETKAPQPVAIKEIPLPVSAAGSIYVGSKNSTVYHYRWCSGGKRISSENLRYFSDPQTAQEAGYRPASNCPGLK